VEELYTKITQRIPNLRERKNQLQMVLAIDQCFKTTKEEVKDGHNICLVEAPTGTGKSLAYLLSGIVNAQALNKKFIISTATKTLQSQLIEKDIPLFSKYSEIPFNACVAKGRGNYLCPYQLELSSAANTGDLLDNTTSNTLAEVRKQFASGSWDGDLDVAPVIIDNKIRPLITTDKERCLGAACAYNQKDECNCPFYNNRSKLKAADVIITNHSLLLADLVLGAGSVLGVKPADYLLCVDEGHTFAAIAINSFTGSFELKNSIAICNNLANFIYNPQTRSYAYTNTSLCDELSGLVTELQASLDDLALILEQNTQLFTEERIILNEYLNQSVGREFQDRFINIALQSSNINAALSNIIDEIKAQIKEKPDALVEHSLNRLGFYLSTIENIMQTAQYVINQDDSRYNANAKWIELQLRKGVSEFVINAGLTHVGNILFNRLWSQVYAAVVTSATLAIGKDFKYNLHKLGLSLYEKVVTYKLETSFMYQQQSQIVVPKFNSAPDFATRADFDRELVEYLNKTIDYSEAYGTLVLFFNRKQLLDVYEKLTRPIQKRILLQTDFMSNQRLIHQHKQTIDKGKPSIIFGLNSFAEGVDLPSIYCMHVIITKIPFETHKDPQNMVQEYWVNFEKSNYFMDVALPETSIRLIQATGRLIRDEGDYGQVTICDNRIIFKNYGTALLNALPLFNRKYNSHFLSESFTKISNLA
jgi:ATP-dependent DNA helicase DinG